MDGEPIIILHFESFILEHFVIYEHENKKILSGFYRQILYLILFIQNEHKDGFITSKKTLLIGEN